MMRPDCPPFLNEDARQAWREVIAEMDRRDLATEPSHALLMGYCTTHARWAQEARWLAEHASEKAGEQSGLTLSFEQAQERLRHENDAQEAWDLANNTAAFFFLSPADRIRIHNIPSASIPRSRRPGRSAGRGGAHV